jgi:hypothetical protein
MLNISCNEFGFLGIDILLKMLNPRKLLKLNVGHTIPSPTATIGLGIHVENYIKQVCHCSFSLELLKNVFSLLLAACSVNLAN